MEYSVLLPTLAGFTLIAVLSFGVWRYFKAKEIAENNSGEK